jgi:hypothetical protein
MRNGSRIRGAVSIRSGTFRQEGSHVKNHRDRWVRARTTQPSWPRNSVRRAFPSHSSAGMKTASPREFRPCVLSAEGPRAALLAANRFHRQLPCLTPVVFPRRCHPVSSVREPSGSHPESPSVSSAGRRRVSRRYRYLASPDLRHSRRCQPDCRRVPSAYSLLAVGSLKDTAWSPGRRIPRVPVVFIAATALDVFRAILVLAVQQDGTGNARRESAIGPKRAVHGWPLREMRRTDSSRRFAKTRNPSHFGS